MSRRIYFYEGELIDFLQRFCNCCDCSVSSHIYLEDTNIVIKTDFNIQGKKWTEEETILKGGL